MIGNAIQLFLKNSQTSAAFNKTLPARSEWKFLQSLLAKKCLNDIDLALAEALLDRVSSRSEAVAALVCHLSLSMRMGHLCARIENQHFEPGLSELWECEAPLLEEERNEIASLVLRGTQEVPQELITGLTTVRDIPSTPLCRLGAFFYFQKYWMRESIVHQALEKLMNTPLVKQVDAEYLQKKLRSLEADKRLLPEQAQAVRVAAQSTVSILCGGPGTGKTYTAGQMIQLLQEAIPGRIALAAPTGKAAANLQKSLRNNGLNLRATTLHQLLGIKGRNPKGYQTHLSADIVLVDESSMIDADLMGQLLMAVKPGARLILLGDPYQLPPVESGSLFSVMLQSKKIPSVELKTCMRAELKELVEFASAINQGSFSKIKALLEQGQVVQRAQEADIPQLVERLSPLFPVDYNITIDDQKVLENFNQFRLLCPIRKGRQGGDEINRLFYQQLAKKRLRKQDVVVPIMLLRNDSRLEIANGETGVLVLKKGDRDGEVRKGDFAILPAKEGGTRRLPALLLPGYEYVYCMSVHKSQGSEFNHVYLWMPEGSEHFGREVLYTAATRARQKLEISVSDASLINVIQKQSKRMSGFFRKS